MTEKQVFLNIKNFSITDYKDDDRFLQLEIWGCCEGINRNDSSFTVNSMIDAIPSLYNTPILCYIDKKKNDATDHRCVLIGMDESGNPIYNYDNGEKIVGIVNESSNIRIEEKDGIKWTVYTALIFVNYNYELKKILQRDKIKSVSIEIKVLESEMINGIEQINKFVYNGTTILGKAVRPGIAGAMLKLFGYNSENFNQFKKQIAFALNEDTNNDKFSIPVDITDYIQKQLIEIKDYPMNTTEQITSVITAKDLLANHEINIEQGEDILKRINEFNIDDSKKILSQLLGGDLMVEFLDNIMNTKIFISKENIGTGEAIKISLTKSSASNDSWGSVSKTNLRNSILKASNYKTLVEKCYLVIDDKWEDSPSESLHYPVCQIKNNTLVYNIHGVQAARAFLEKNKDAPYYDSANTKLNKIYKKLGLDYDKNHIKYQEKEVQGMIKKFQELFAEENKYKCIGFNENNVCVYSLEANKFSIIPYAIDSESHITMDIEAMKDASMFCNFSENDGDEEKFECNNVMSETLSEAYCDIKNMEKEKETLMSEKDAEIAKSKKLEEEKDEFSKEKEKAIEEKQMAESEKEKALSEKSDIEKKFSDLKNENEKVLSEIKEFREQKITEIIKQCSFEYKMSDEDVQTWTEKSKSFAKIEDFEKELVFAFHKAKKEDIHFKMGGNIKNNNQSKSAIERLRAKQ